MDSDDTNAALVARVRLGETKAFDQLVRRHLRLAHSVARSTLDNPDDADDVCQDAFIRALERIDDCRNPERFGSWLMAIVRNTAHNRREHSRVRATLPLEEARSATSGDDPLAAVGRMQLRRQLREAIRQLTELQRRVLLLYDLEGWSHKEIAGELGISSGSSRVHLHVARKAMRKLLAGRVAPGTP